MATTTVIECDRCGDNLPTGVQAAAYVTLFHRVGDAGVTELQFCYTARADGEPSCGDLLMDLVDTLAGAPVCPPRPVPVPLIAPPVAEANPAPPAGNP